MSKYNSLKHAKFRIMYHLIFSCKYRRKALASKKISGVVKQSMLEASGKNKDFSVYRIETDKDHIHVLVHATPNIAPYKIVHCLKQRSTFEVWNRFPLYMKQFYWSGKHKLWTRGYFCSSIGDVSEKTLIPYIENQG